MAHVSILARPFGRALLHGGRSPATVPCGFNPRPAFWPGDTTAADRRRRSRVVSILARPFGRALLLHASPMHVWSLFQSSPGLLAGRVNQVDVVGGAAASFQSSPGLLAGRYAEMAEIMGKQIMFQSSPGLLAGRYLADATSERQAVLVSILARPFGRALRHDHLKWDWWGLFQSSPGLLAGRVRFLWRQLARYCSFNPRPAFWPGAYSAGRHAVTRGRHCFNPRPAFWPGAAINWGVFRPIFLVSILARPFGRAIPGDLHSRRRAHGRFQSSPGLLAGRTRQVRAAVEGQLRFQSSPGLLAGRVRSMSTILPSTRCMFQSSPGLLAGRYPQRCVMMLSTIWFQSSPGLLAGRYGMLATTDLEQFQFQSSPGLLAGRYFQGPWGLPFTPSFNPRPAFWPGAADQHRGPDRPHQVSILARPFGRARTGGHAPAICLRFSFQSSPGLLAGRDGPTHAGGVEKRRFNPRPAFWPGGASAPVRCRSSR